MESQPNCGCSCQHQKPDMTPAESWVPPGVPVQIARSSDSTASSRSLPSWITGYVETPAGRVPEGSTRLSAGDVLGAWKARWNIRRMHYHIDPGLYAVGRPGPESTVLVTANYKLSFDQLRQELGGRDAWLLVLDTRGINVWCAAGKGLFSTDELIKRIQATGLERVITHRTLILPQLAGPGVSVHRVRQESGFRVMYGPVRARDLPAFLDNGRKATPAMRTVTFTLADRLILMPVEFVTVMKYFLYYLAAVVLLEVFLGPGTLRHLSMLTVPVLGALLLGTVLVPALLPWLPFRSFTLKGWLPGLLWAAAVSAVAGADPWQTAGNLLLLPVLSAGFALTFTGSTTFTSQTGVNREISLYARPMAISGLLGVAGMVLGLIFR